MTMMKKRNHFATNKVKAYILPEKIFSAILDGTKTDEEITSSVRYYIENTPEIEKARLTPTENTEFLFEADMTEEVKIAVGMDPDDAEIILEHPTVKQYTFKTTVLAGDNIYLLEQLFNGVKVYKTKDGKLGYKTLDKTIETSKKGSIVVLQSVKTGEVIVGYKFVPNKGYNYLLKNKSAKELEIELKQIRNDNGLMFVNGLTDQETDSEDYKEFPTFTPPEVLI